MCTCHQLTKASDAPKKQRVMNDCTSWNLHSNRYMLMNEKFIVLGPGRDPLMYILCFEDSDKRPKENGPFFDAGDVKMIEAMY